MNTDKIKSSIADAREICVRTEKLLTFAEQKLIPILEQCTDSTSVDLTIGIAWIHVYNREDIARLMTLAPRWDKSKGNQCIEYRACINDDLRFALFARDGALPPTCKVQKVTRHVPAVEAHDVEEETIVCERPGDVASPDTADSAPSTERALAEF
jgi:desulfoferrodoxin (superoxide reductase-like protein)